MEREEITLPRAIVLDESVIFGEKLFHRLKRTQPEPGEDGVIIDVRILDDEKRTDLDVLAIGPEFFHHMSLGMVRVEHDHPPPARQQGFHSAIVQGSVELPSINRIRGCLMDFAALPK